MKTFARIRGAVSVPAAMVLTLTLAGAGCGRGSSSGPAHAPQQQSATENQINAQSRDKIRDGGALTWPLDDMPTTFNYNQINMDEYSWYVIGALMPRMYLSDAAASAHWNPDYLASEPALVTDPKEVITYEINPKATWDDGTPITWQDFYWQWKASNGADARYQIVSANGYEDIESVIKGKDDREVIVTFKRKYADWRSLFVPLYPASTNKDPKIFNDGWNGRFLTTAGPFRFDSLDQTSKTITLVRNEKWWGRPAKLDKIVFRVIDTNAQIDALANGEIDAMDIGSDPNRYRRALEIPSVEIRRAGGPNFTPVTLNGTGPILSDLRVRQAVANAIDRAAIARAMLGPLGMPAVPLNNHIFMENQVGYQDNSGDVGKYDPARSKQLLDAAGWKLDGNVRKKDGRPLTLTCVIPTATASSQQIAELLQNMLGQVGISMTINAVPGDDFFSKYVTLGQFDLTIFSWMGTSFPISSSKSIYVKPTRNPKGGLDIQQNYARIGSDEIDRAYTEATEELDPKKAINLANQVDALIWQEVHSLTLYQRPELWATKKDLANFGAVGFADYVYEDIGWVK